MQAVFDNRIRFPLSSLTDEQLQKLQQQFTYENPEYKKLKAIRRYVSKNVPEFLRSWELSNDGHFTVPRGALSKVVQVVGELELKKQLSYGRPDLAGRIPRHRLTMRGYQEAILKTCTDAKGGTCTVLVRSPQGSGKTTAGFAIAAEFNLPTLVVVPTEKIFKQWVEGAEKNLGLKPSDVGRIQGSKHSIKPLTIGMQQTLRNCMGTYLDVFGVVIGDEAQRFGANTFFDVLDISPAAYRIGLTADERRADKKEFLVYDVFGPVQHEVSRKMLIEEGAIIDAEIRIIPSDFKAEWYNQLEPLKRARVENQRRLQEELESDVARNELIMEVLSWCVDEDQPTITLAWHRDHCATLNSLSISKGWDSGLLLGGKESNDEFIRTEREMRSGMLKQAVGTYQAIGVGFDLPCVSRGIFAAPCASRDGKQQFGQFCGRFERPDIDTGKIGRDDAIIYYIWDREVHGLWPVKHISRWKPKVSVLDGDEWIDAKKYIKREEARNEDKDREEDEKFGFVQARSRR